MCEDPSVYKVQMVNVEVIVVLRLEDKKEIVAEVSAVAARASSAIAAEYRGLTVAEMTEMRIKAREAGVFLKVVRNTLARRAMENTDCACMSDKLVASVAVRLAYVMKKVYSLPMRMTGRATIFR